MTTAPAPGNTGLEVEPGPPLSRRVASRLTLLGYPLIALGYIATGRLGLLLAMPPGYATAIFPPSGIAATAMLVAGWASLPWTFLGSLVLNLWIGLAAGNARLTPVLWTAVLIAAASTAQAALLGWTLRRAIGYPTALDTGRQLRSFLLLSPVCCLTSASLSITGLWALGVLTEQELPSGWLVWWVGDTLGVLITLPLVLVGIGEPRDLWRARFRPVALPMLLFFGLFVAIFIRVSAWENDQLMVEFRLVSQQVVDKIRTQLEVQEVFLEQLERAFATRVVPIARAEFNLLADRVLRRFPMLQAVEWAPRVTRSERAAFEKRQQSEISDFEIREIGQGQPRRAGEHETFYPVTYVEPLPGNEKALGIDLASNPEREAAVGRALTSGALSVTRPIRLVQEPGQQLGLLLLLPVRTGATGPGLVLVALRVGAFLDGLLTGLEQTLHLRLIDAGRQQMLYDGFVGDGRPAPYRQEFAFGQRHFTVESEPTAAYLAQKRGWQSWLLLSAGVLGTGLLGALLLLGTGYARRIRAQVDERTGDLAAANRELLTEIEERRNAETALQQAQRIEIVGRLTGGIAHDFNNLLTVVSANAELLRGDALGDPAQQRATAILRAASRGERLVRQLLAFSRRQALRPEAIDLRRRTGEIGEMLARTMRADIEVILELPAGLWPVAIDAGEFDLAVLNVAINARDAMPSGGRFCIGAHNLAISSGDPVGEGLVGDFVALTLSDTGSGMPAEIATRAFDPYFTTKAVGSGSGLGLSRVYGFARQSGGNATLSSEPGLGTSVTLFLPRARSDAFPPEVAAPNFESTSDATF